MNTKRIAELLRELADELDGGEGAEKGSQPAAGDASPLPRGHASLLEARRPPNPAKDRPRDLLDAVAVAERLGVSKSHAYQVMREAKHVYVGRSIRIEVRELEEYIRLRSVPARPSAAAIVEAAAETRRRQVRGAPAPMLDKKGRPLIRTIVPRAPAPTESPIKITKARWPMVKPEPSSAPSAEPREQAPPLQRTELGWPHR